MINTISLQTFSKVKLIMILTRRNEKFRYRNNSRTTNKIYDIDDIDNIETIFEKDCKYAQEHIYEKTHIVIRFSVKNEVGIICLNLLLNEYEDLLLDSYEDLI
jgi:hypothetical protein